MAAALVGGVGVFTGHPQLILTGVVLGLCAVVAGLVAQLAGGVAVTVLRPAVMWAAYHAFRTPKEPGDTGQGMPALFPPGITLRPPPVPFTGSGRPSAEEP